ncbi:MAG: hypothetical protein JWM11_3140 [Planctomycetaceae bacterium]|nr:hypothetical protein [Planctomycetaceae bacterium]
MSTAEKGALAAGAAVGGLIQVLCGLALLIALIVALVFGLQIFNLQRTKLKLEIVKLRAELREKGIEPNEILDEFGNWKDKEQKETKKTKESSPPLSL